MNRLENIIQSFQGLNVLIVGDVMIDAYLSGSVTRQSPEDPTVPVVFIEEEIYRLGGAANVALNVMTLEANPFICSVIGNKKDSTFLDLIEKRGFDKSGLVISDSRKTTQKTRVIDGAKHLLRVDEEDTHDLSAEDESALLSHIDSVLESHKIDVIILQDYNKGVLTDEVIKHCISAGKQHSIPVAVDPKLKRFTDYKGVTLFKPNLKEIKEGLEIKVDGSNADSVKDAMTVLEEKLENEISFVTLSEYGVAIKKEANFQTIKAHKRNITDVSGAGDTVISVAALCLALQCEITELAELSNLAGGLVCEEVGVVPIQKDKLLEEAKRIYAS